MMSDQGNIMTSECKIWWKTKGSWHQKCFEVSSQTRQRATLHPKRAPCKERVRQKRRWTTKCQLTNQRTRGPYNKRTRRQDNKRGKRIIYRYDMRTRSRTQKTEEQEDKGEDKGNIWHEDKSKRRQITEEQEDKGNIWHDDKRGQEDRGQKNKGTR